VLGFEVIVGFLSMSAKESQVKGRIRGLELICTHSIVAVNSTCGCWCSASQLLSSCYWIGIRRNIWLGRARWR